jgi:hypothetical protein
MLQIRPFSILKFLINESVLLGTSAWFLKILFYQCLFHHTPSSPHPGFPSLTPLMQVHALYLQLASQVPGWLVCVVQDKGLVIWSHSRF